MTPEDFKYVEIVTGHTSNRGNIVELKGDFHNIDYFGKTGKVNCFHSAFLQCKDYVDYKGEGGGKVGYNGPCFTPLLYWDFDSDKLTDALADTIELVESLIAYKQQNIRIWYSGNRGFHVTYMSPDLAVMTNYHNFNETVKGVCLFFGKGMKTLDKKIYDKTRIFRTPNSVHPETKLYKIELSYNQLKTYTIEMIKLEAKEQRKLDFNPDLSLDPDFAEILNQKHVTESSVRVNNFSFDELLTGVEYGFNEGNRNSGLASVVGMLHKRNLDDTFVAAIVRGINRNSKEPISENEVNGIVESVCRYPVDSSYVPVTNEDIVTFRQAGERWEKMIKSSGEFSLGPRFTHFNDVLGSAIRGDVIGIVANSGSGKSSIMLEFGNNHAKMKGGYSLFCSLEMASHSCYFRAATMTHEADEQGEISSKVVAKDLLNDPAFRDYVERDWDNTLIADKGSLSLEQIEELYYKAQEMTGNKIVSLSIDYLQYVNGMADVNKALVIARSVKDLAKRLGTIVFVALQANKTLADSYTEPADQNIEGIKAITQMLDFQIWLWKSSDDRKRLHVKFSKTRWSKDDVRMDLVREGLKYHSDDYKLEKPKNYL